MADGGSQPTGGAAFLGVGRSLSGRPWRLRAFDDTAARDHMMALGLSEPLARAIAARGVAEGQGAQYLSPTLKAQFPDPSTFAGMDEAVQILLDALTDGRPTTVFADYDVDGASSAALLVRWFRAMGRELPIYIPDRLTEGYGPSAPLFQRLAAEGCKLVITLDCGAAAHEAIDSARDAGLDVVVIDHHLMRGDPPRAAAIVNPNRPDCTSGQGNLAAAGVAFVLLAALTRGARARGLFADLPEPDLRQWLDLAALGAICDVTSLVGFNRALASQGLKVMSAWRNPGLAALMEVAGASGPAGAFHAGFILGPRINAGGRIGRSDLGARLLSTDDPEEARTLAAELDRLNVERKSVEREVIDAAVAMVESQTNFDPEAAAMVVAGDGWHAGVIGIVAGRLRERYRRPVVVIGVDRAGDVAKGSGRSQPGVNLGRAIQSAYDEGLLLAGGGHAMAAGLTMRPALIPEFREYLLAQLAQEMDDAEDPIEIDALISPEGADRILYEDFQRLAPFGPGNPEPLFAIADARIEEVMALKGGHLRMIVRGSGGRRLKAMAWRAEETALGQRLKAGGSLHIVGRLKPDDWRGRSDVEFEIEDAADPRMIL